MHVIRDVIQRVCIYIYIYIQRNIVVSNWVTGVLERCLSRFVLEVKVAVKELRLEKTL